MNTMNIRLLCASVLTLATAASSLAQPKAPTAPQVTGTAGVKAYLTDTLAQIRAAATDFKTAATEYDALATAAGSAENAAKTKPNDVAALIKRLRSDYEKIDSFGYEYIEGIVAGVPALKKYDTELDAGVPAKGAKPDDEIAQITLTGKGPAGDLQIDKEGSLNNYLIEPTVFGTNPKFISGQASLPGLGDKVGLPNPKLALALADYAIDGYRRLSKDAQAWQPTDKECFEVLVAMTPTLADYFDDWKESKKATGEGAAGGRFVAVSRVSDMRGIMSSTRLAWEAVASKVSDKDQSLASSVSTGYDGILSFIDTVDAREKQAGGKGLTPEAIDALGTQAKEKADKLTVQAAQASALLGYTDVKGK